MTGRAQQTQAAATSFLALCSIVGLALYGLPLYYDFMVREFGWSRTQVTSGNALSKLVVGPLFGFLAGWIIDRFGPRRIMLVGILLAGGALIGLGGMSALWMFYAFYLVNAIGYVCGGPLPNQVLLSQWFKDGRGKAMGFAYLGIGLGGEYLIIPLMAAELFGVGVLGRVMGIIVTADGVAEAVSPMLVGYLRDVTGSYGTGFAGLVVVALVGAAAVALLPRGPLENRSPGS